VRIAHDIGASSTSAARLVMVRQGLGDPKVFVVSPLKGVVHVPGMVRCVGGHGSGVAAERGNSPVIWGWHDSCSQL
jgi:hypothetical protein